MGAASIQRSLGIARGSGEWGSNPEGRELEKVFRPNGKTVPRMDLAPSGNGIPLSKILKLKGFSGL
jgi:hypothetical protein